MTTPQILGMFSAQAPCPPPSGQGNVSFLITVSVNKAQTLSPVTNTITISGTTESVSGLIMCFKGDTIYWSVSCQVDNYTLQFYSLSQNANHPIFEQPSGLPSASISTIAQNTGNDNISFGFTWASNDGSGSTFPIELSDGTPFTVDPYVSCNNSFME